MLLAVFHCGFGAFVVGSSSTFTDTGGGDFGDDVFEGTGLGFHGTGASRISDCAEANRTGFGLFFRKELNEVSFGEKGAIAFKDFPLVREIEVGQLDVFEADVLPDVHLCPVTQGEDTEVFAVMLASVEDVPEFRALVFGVPFAKLGTGGKETFLGPGFFFVATSSTKSRVVLVFFNGIEKDRDLQCISSSTGSSFITDFALINLLLHTADHQASSNAIHQFIPILNRLFKVMAGINVYQREWDFGGPEGFDGKMGHDNGVFAAREEQGRVFELCSSLTKYIDGFGFEVMQVSYSVVVHRVDVGLKLNSG